MGIIIAKFRKKTSTFDTLTKLENEIIAIEDFQKRTQQTQRKIVFRFLLLAGLSFALLAFILYFYFSQISQNEILIWSLPLILIAFPLVICLIKKFLTWYYNRKIRKNETKLVKLKEKKKEILENVIETETYKIAKQILDKFGNEPKKSISTPQIQKATPIINTGPKGYQSVLRQRNIAAQSAMSGRVSFGGPPETPQPQRQVALSTPGIRGPMNIFPTPGHQLALSPSMQGPTLARNILPRDRSVLDKMVDYLVGDGPSNRYALICQKCSSHNGMALKEEFEYLAFRCCYCNTFNPARKKRPVGPKFNSPLMLGPSANSGGGESSDSERNSENDSDAESKPIIEEPRSDSPDTVKTSDFEKVSDSELPGNESKMEVEDLQSSETTADLKESEEGTLDSRTDVSDQ